MDIHDDDEIALRTAAKQNKLNFVEFLLDHGARIQDDLVASIIPKTSRCIHGNLEMIKYLISRGADITWNDSRALIRAVKYMHLSITELLLQNGACADAWGGKALHIASEYGDEKMIELLQEYGASFD